MIGTSLSHCRITEKLGQGGMAEVYRAEDTNLSRHVAIKVLPDEFAHDAERLARFERKLMLRLREDFQQRWQPWTLNSGRKSNGFITLSEN